MDTPLSSRRRKVAPWLMETRRLDVSSGNDSPTTMKRKSDVRCSPMTSSLRGCPDFDDEADDDEDDYMMSATQMIYQKREVYWNYESSPRSREELRRQLAADDDDDDVKNSRKSKPKPNSKPTTPAIKLRSSRPKVPSFADLQNDEDFKFLSAIAMNISREQSSSEPTSTATSSSSSASTSGVITATASDEISPVKSEPGSDDPFDQDDSFLVECSQAMEEKEILKKPLQPQPLRVDSNYNHHQFKIPLPATVTQNNITATANVAAIGDASVFDEDDAEEFESLLSQIEIPETVVSKPPSKNIHSDRLSKTSSACSLSTASSRPSASFSSVPMKPKSAMETRSMTAATNRSTSGPMPVPKPVLPMRDAPSSNASSNLFKRYKSADDAAKQTAMSTMTSTSTRPYVTPNFRSTSTTMVRRNTEPETPPGPLPGGRQQSVSVAPKCTKEEIERKRLEALRRRHLSSQKIK